MRPLAVAIRSRNPCLFLRLRTWGWNVLFIAVYVFSFLKLRETTSAHHISRVQIYDFFSSKQTPANLLIKTFPALSKPHAVNFFRTPELRPDRRCRARGRRLCRRKRKMRSCFGRKGLKVGERRGRNILFLAYNNSGNGFFYFHP